MFSQLSPAPFISLARNKLQNASVSGTRDNLRLCRLVLLKNAITSALSAEPASADTPTLPTTYDDFEQEEDLFLFPTGDVFAESFMDETEPDVSDVDSEARWLDSLLEQLGDEDNDDLDMVTVSRAEEDDDDEDFDYPSLTNHSSEDVSLTSPEFITLPPSPPLDSSLPSYMLSLQSRYNHLISSSVSDSQDHDPDLPMLDSVDECSDDDSESLNTPHSDRSLSSLVEGDCYQNPYMKRTGIESLFDQLDLSSPTSDPVLFDREC
ncbi:hypothetical protein SISNIDRAFT_492279 [Sistotremastrum niveocremeum HHB9708]|uniref:Uncharacterized protein n=2 Tax=Sistotremastraceae TaxID=3402574 RepID=A0A165AGD7_9AGAM|nr:hypothetical protein SISNIDRAFT_492279 [Sistotremastrum niveocremeum HHB9708]KZT44157.1 hypothetical protein SISSUDRAFT_1115959 [Sistotremastrum suecicum HHB10207 ss-3]